MAIATYADLQSLMGSYLGHDLFASQYADFITLFEASACRRLHVRENTTTATITPSSGVGALPADYLGARRLTWTGSPNVELTYLHPTALRAMYPSESQATPRHYTIEGGSIIIRPVDAADLQLLYVQKTAAVSSTLNWLFTKHPDAYLFGALCEAEAFGVNDERAALWRARMEAVFEEIRRQDFNNRPPMQIRTLGPTP